MVTTVSRLRLGSEEHEPAMTLREEQETALQEAARRIASRIDQVFSFDPKKLEDFRSSKIGNGPVKRDAAQAA